MKKLRLGVLVCVVVIAGLVFSAVLLTFSFRIPGLPSWRYAQIVNSKEAVGDAVFLAHLDLHHWFVESVLPSLAAIGAGLVASFLSQLSLRHLFIAGLIFAGVKLAMFGGASPAAWIGVVVFQFCLVGSWTVFVHLRSRLSSRVTE